MKKVIFLGMLTILISVSCSGPSTGMGPDGADREGVLFSVIGSYGSKYHQLTIDAGAPPAFARFGSTFVKAAEDVSSLVKRNKPEFIITTGDNNYPEGSQETIDLNIGSLYSDYIGNYKGTYGSGAATNRFYPSLGNHDKLIIEAWLVKSDRDITLGLFNLPPLESRVYRFGMDLYLATLAEYFGSPLNEQIFSSLRDNGHLDRRDNVPISGTIAGANSRDTAYWPNKRITLSLFSAELQQSIRNVSFMGARLNDNLINHFLNEALNEYKILEVDGADDNWQAPYLDYFTLPGNERYYQFTKIDEDSGDSVDFFVLNLEGTFNSDDGNEPDGTTVGSRQYNWFVEQTSKSTADFKVAYSSAEVYTSFEDFSFTDWKFEEHVDILFHGDIQAYERILADKTSSGGGKAYFISAGVGGIPLEMDEPTNEAFASEAGVTSQKIVQDTFGAVFVTINNGIMKGEFKDTDGVVQDSFMITRNQDGSKDYR